MMVVKSTVNLNKYYKDQLEYLVEIKEIKSVTEGINIALENFIKEKQEKIYYEQMKKAANDPAFIKRTMTSQEEFEKIDNDLDKLNSMENFEW